MTEPDLTSSGERNPESERIHRRYYDERTEQLTSACRGIKSVALFLDNDGDPAVAAQNDQAALIQRAAELERLLTDTQERLEAARGVLTRMFEMALNGAVCDPAHPCEMCRAILTTRERCSMSHDPDDPDTTPTLGERLQELAALESPPACPYCRVTNGHHPNCEYGDA